MDKGVKEESLNGIITSDLGTNVVKERSYGSFEYEPQSAEHQCLLERQYKVETPKPSHRIPWKIYISRALSAWGDRIWAFGVGIFMNKLAPENLRLVAIQGFVISISVILFGAAIGNWIDRNKRLLAAKVFLAIQNVSVAIACVVLVVHFLLLDTQVILMFVSNLLF